MKPLNLMFSTALASAMLLAPAAATHADAAGIKIKPQIVKVKPKIAAAKPKIRVKVRAAKVRVKPKLKVRAAKLKIKPRAPKLKMVVTPKIKPKLTRTVRIKPVVKTRIAPKIATARISTRAKVIVPRAKPVTGNRSAATGLRSKRINTASLGNQRGIRDAMNGVREIGAMKDVVTLGKLRVGATAGLGLNTPDLKRPHMSNQDRLGAVPGAGKKTSMFGTDLGSGPGGFASLSTSHNSETPNNPWAVTGESIANAMGGVAGKTKQANPDPNPVVDSQSKTVDNVTTTTTTRQDGTVVYEKSEKIFSASDPERAIGFIGTTTSDRSSTGGGTTTLPWYEDTQGNRQFTSPRSGSSGGAQGGLNERRDPGYAGGGDPDCRDIGCLVRGGGKPKGLQYADVKNGKNQVFTSPENAQPNGANGTAPVYSANDVLERYDDDSRRRGDGRTVIIERLQSD